MPHHGVWCSLCDVANKYCHWGSRGNVSLRRPAVVCLECLPRASLAWSTHPHAYGQRWSTIVTHSHLHRKPHGGTWYTHGRAAIPRHAEPRVSENSLAYHRVYRMLGQNTILTAWPSGLEKHETPQTAHPPPTARIFGILELILDNLGFKYTIANL